MAAAVSVHRMRIPTILADNGKEFTDRLFGLRKRAATAMHEFDQLCAELGIEHRLDPPQHPQTIAGQRST